MTEETVMNVEQELIDTLHAGDWDKGKMPYLRHVGVRADNVIKTQHRTINRLTTDLEEAERKLRVIQVMVEECNF